MPHGTFWAMKFLRCSLLPFLLLSTVALAEPEPDPTLVPPLECVRLLRQARIIEDLEMPDAAFLKLQEAAKLYPGQVTPIRELLSFSIRHNLDEADRTALRRTLLGLISNPRAALPNGTLGYLVYNPEISPDEAEAILHAVHQRIDADAPDPEMLRMAANLEQRLERREEARRTLNRLLEIDPDPSLYRQRLYLDMHLEDWEAAAAGLEQMLEFTDSPFDRALYIRMLGKLGRLDDLIRQTELLENGSPLDLYVIRGMVDDLLVQVAWDLRDAGRDEEAESLFRRVLKGDPDNAEVQTTLLHLYSTAEEKELHREQIEHRWASEEDLSILLKEGVDRVAAGDVEGGIDLLERAARGMPGSELAWYNLGLAALRLERWEQAEEAFAFSIRLNDQRMESVLYRGAALQALGRYKEAIQDLNRAQAMKPEVDVPEVHFYLFRCYRGLQDAKAAAKELTIYNQSRRE